MKEIIELLQELVGNCGVGILLRKRRGLLFVIPITEVAMEST